ncbi:acetoacetate decarboxylase family protein [Microbispora sp. CA-102843]|uniref:acetoacetate decarboxylase family protein n=1 Tax=Microbispora sp. CA-102843 TaxID=3239952 RepID=UPI003D89CBD6
MRENYNPLDFWQRLDYAPAAEPYSAPELSTVTVYCRGDADQLERMLRPTPFVLADDRFVVTVADFSSASNGGFMDCGVIVPVRYGDLVGGFYLAEYENHSWSVAAGRELWGYPKRFADMRVDRSDDAISCRVSAEGRSLVEIDWKAADSTGTPPWHDVVVYPHLLVRAVPQVDGHGFALFDVLSRDTSRDFVTHSERRGRAELTLGEGLVGAGERLTVVEVLGATHSVGDFYSTERNGVPTVVASLA